MKVVALLLVAFPSGCAAYNGLFGVCEGDLYSSYVGQSIPDNDDTGVTSTISVPLSGYPDGIGLRLNLEHELESDLQIRLAHGSSVIEIEDVGDHGPFHQWDSVDVGGTWTINVVDRYAADTGYWTDWELTVCGE